MRKLSLWHRIEQPFRVLTFIIFSVYCGILMLSDHNFRSFYVWVNKKSGNYFRRNFKLKEPIEYLGKIWASHSLTILGIHTIIENSQFEWPQKNTDTSILMFTHGSNLDPITLQGYYPYFLHFVAKESLFKVPLIGKALKASNQIPIKRTNITEAIHALEEAGRQIKEENASICISPEGTRRRKASSGPEQEFTFKKGPFHLSKAAGVDVIPVVIIGANRLFPPGTLYPMPGTTIVRFGQKIPGKEVQELAIPELQERVKKGFKENLTEVDDKIIYSTEQKPYRAFLVYLTAFVLIFWFSVRFFCSLF